MAYFLATNQQADNPNNQPLKAITLNLAIVIGCWGLILLGFMGCKSSDKEVDPTIDVKEVVIDSVYLLPVDESVITKGEEVQLQAVVKKEGVEDTSAAVLWSSSDPNILSVNKKGLITGVGGGDATVFAHVGDQTDSLSFFVVDLTGTWIGGVAPDTVRYILTQTDTIVDGIFKSDIGFPSITNVNEGTLTGYLSYPDYFHILELKTENGCTMRVTGEHLVRFDGEGKLVLVPGKGVISSPDCNLSGTIHFATLRRE